MKTPAHIKIALAIILLTVTVWADDSVRRPAVNQSWKSGSTMFTQSDSTPATDAAVSSYQDNRGISEDAKKANGITGVPWAWVVLVILTATVIDLVRRGIRYNQKNMKINRP